MESLSWGQIIVEVLIRFIPVWISLVLTFSISIYSKRRTGLYGKLFDSPLGMVGFGIVMFWVFTAIFADLIMTHDPLTQVSGMKNKLPGYPMSSAGKEGVFQHYLLGGDRMARDVFSRVVLGSRIVLIIAPAATAFAFMVGITLGLPAGYYGGRFDTTLSFISNLVLAFPVILLFFLLVTPEIRLAGIEIGTYTWTIPTIMASILFIFPIIFTIILFNSRYFTQWQRPARIGFCATPGDRRTSGTSRSSSSSTAASARRRSAARRTGTCT
jgi:peptide/nickel transport system permease protein